MISLFKLAKKIEIFLIFIKNLHDFIFKKNVIFNNKKFQKHVFNFFFLSRCIKHNSIFIDEKLILFVMSHKKISFILVHKYYIIVRT